MCRISTQAVLMSKLSKPTRQTRQGSRAQQNGDLRNQGPVKIAEASSPIFGMPWCSHGASIVVDERQSIPCLKISGKDLRKVVLQDLDLQDLQNSPHRPTLPMMAMMAMMASGQGDSVALETLETLPPWRPIGPILPVSLPLPGTKKINPYD